MIIHVLLNFKTMPFAELDTFVQSVITKMTGEDRYAACKPQLEIVTPLYDAYVSALVAARDGGKLLIEERNQAKTALLMAVTNLATAVQLHANGDETYPIGAGFRIRKKPSRNNSPFEKPQWKTLRRGKLSGTVEGIVANFPHGVKQIGISYSTDGWTTSKNGTYSGGKSFTLADLPSRQEVEVKVRFLGTYQRVSDESEPMPIFVL